MIVLLLLFGLALGAVVPPNEQRVALQRGSCPMFWYSFNGRCYKYLASPMSWADAQLHCMSLRANLVSIHSQQEQNFVNSLIRNFDPAVRFTWIGLNDIYKEGRWMWSDASQANFFFWQTGQPDNSRGWEHCGHTNWGSTLRWNDGACSSQLPFVCALRTVCL
ncbi:galactose-specific lectin nattectin-like [Stegastes partitus]|uniref:Galactose-specific lectin nattectin-like n=1 Tax=Stegastes partitus TaxID=144197 RepID=A0A9Y4TQB4_9TELE|nr:PREDICTED: galactose-specific lectin nattectin-like [Stegastes partitus]